MSSAGLVAVVPPNGAFEQSGGLHEAEPSSPSPSAPHLTALASPDALPARVDKFVAGHALGAAPYETHPRQRAPPPARARSTASARWWSA